MPVRNEPIEISTPDGVAGAFAFRPDLASRPGIVMICDAYGVRDAFRDMAARLAGLGYVVLLPNVFYRAGDFAPFDQATAWTDPAERARIMALLQSLTPERVRADTAAYFEALAKLPGVRGDRLGIVGYCMGGRIAFLTAGLHGDRVRAAASFHGGNLASDAPDSPHRLAGDVRASLYFGIADADRSFPPEQQGALASALGAAGVAYRMELYPGKKHGFAVTDHAAAYDRDAAERHWRRLEWFFGETLD